MSQVFHLLPTHMTSTHPRRAAAQAEADAWLDLHADWAKGLPADVRDTTVRGELFHSCLGDGWDTLWWRSASDSSAPSARPTSTTPQCAVDADYDQSLPTIERRRIQAGRLGDFGIQQNAPPRIVARAGTEQLSAVTAVLGDRVARSLLFRSCPIPSRTRSGDGFAYRRRAGRTQAFGDLSGHVDSSWIEQLAAAELVEWLRAEARCTEREIEALERRAAGQPVPDRHCLARAQRRAQAAMA